MAGQGSRKVSMIPGAPRVPGAHKLVSALFEVVDFDKEDARRAGEIRAVLAMSGSPIGPYDVLIAGQASVRNLVLVTNNLSEFARVSELVVEDWSTS